MDVRPKPPSPAATTHTASGVRATQALGPSEGDAKPPEVQRIEGTHEHFELRAEIARGGMGRIVEAYDRRHDRLVALKFLLRADDASARRFQRDEVDPGFRTRG